MNMTDIFPEIQVGEALTHSGLAVFPLYVDSRGGVDYQVAAAALASGQVSVEEVDSAGQVPFLRVTNSGDTRVFFMEGEELVGGKQNRAVNTSVLAGSNSSIRIPVSCVEERRWHFGGFNRDSDAPSEEMVSELNCFSPEVRLSLRESVSESLLRKQGHSSAQGELWEEIKKEQDDLKVSSSTRAMKDTYESYRARLEEFKASLKYPGEAVGMVGVVDGELVSFDLFDRESTCASFWERLVSSYTLSRLKKRALALAGSLDEEFDLPDIEGFIEASRKADWRTHEAVGEGVEYRAKTEDGMEGFALQFDGKLVHGSLLAAK